MSSRVLKGIPVEVMREIDQLPKVNYGYLSYSCVLAMYSFLSEGRVNVHTRYRIPKSMIGVDPEKPDEMLYLLYFTLRDSSEFSDVGTWQCLSSEKDRVLRQVYEEMDSDDDCWNLAFYAYCLGIVSRTDYLRNLKDIPRFLSMFDRCGEVWDVDGIDDMDAMMGVISKGMVIRKGATGVPLSSFSKYYMLTWMFIIGMKEGKYPGWEPYDFIRELRLLGGEGYLNYFFDQMHGIKLDIPSKPEKYLPELKMLYERVPEHFSYGMSEIILEELYKAAKDRPNRRNWELIGGCGGSVGWV